MDAMQNNQHVPSGFPGVDFFLTEIQVQLMFATNFLEELATQDYYREYLEHNFDEKIFFHEPVNKYFDLLWIRKLCFNSLKSFKQFQNPFKVNQSRVQAMEAEIVSQIETIYAEGKQARLISINNEKLALLVQKVSMNRVTDELKSRIANHDQLDRYVMKLIDSGAAQ